MTSLVVQTTAAEDTWFFKLPHQTVKFHNRDGLDVKLGI